MTLKKIFLQPIKGIPPIIYLLLNKTVRRDVYNMLVFVVSKVFCCIKTEVGLSNIWNGAVSQVNQKFDDKKFFLKAEGLKNEKNKILKIFSPAKKCLVPIYRNHQPKQNKNLEYLLDFVDKKLLVFGRNPKI